MNIGDKVTLTPVMRRAATEPEKYEVGTIVRLGSWGIVDVLWNGIDHPIGMRSIELVSISEDTFEDNGHAIAWAMAN